MVKTRQEMRDAYDDTPDPYPSRYEHTPAREQAIKARLVSLQQTSPSGVVYESDPFGHLAAEQARRRRGGWVAPLQPEQFAGSPQADTQVSGDGGGGDSGGSV